jgi:hypothetical protein
MRLPSVKVFFAWYDIWVGVFWDKKKRSLYICFVPMVVVCLTWPKPDDLPTPYYQGDRTW